MGILQNIEVWKCPTHQYINIHKSGSSTIRSYLTKLYKEADRQVVYSTTSDNIVWTVTRDPYNRFIDSLSYDLKYLGLEVSVDNIEKTIGSKTKLYDYIFGLSNPNFRGRGTVRHSMLQTTYLFDNNIDIIVDAKDLGIFCEMHFPTIEISQENMNMGDFKAQKIVSNYLDENKELKETLKGYLAIDYFTLERFNAVDRKWHWANGKLF